MIVNRLGRSRGAFVIGMAGGALAILAVRLLGWPVWLAIPVSFVLALVLAVAVALLIMWLRVRRAQRAIARIWPGEWPPAA